MGLIQAFVGSVRNTFGEMWKDYIYCDSLGADILVKKGIRKLAPGARYSDENVITDGSKIAVNVGQMLIVTENGKIIDYTDEPGGYIFNSSASPYACGKGFGDTIKKTFKHIGAHASYGGALGVDQRAYFINTKEIIDNKFGFGNIPFRDNEFNLTIILKGFGAFAYKIIDPLLFFSNISGNVRDEYHKDTLAPQIKAEFQGVLLPALSLIAKEGIKYDELPARSHDITEALKQELWYKWANHRGIEITAVTLSNIIPDEESIDKIRDLQESKIFSQDKRMLGARVGAAQANAMEDAAKNPNGAAASLIGVSMAERIGGVNVNQLMDGPEEQKDGPWVCECGQTNTLNYCVKCGKPRRKCPKCGFSLDGKANFCPNCGHKIP